MVTAPGESLVGKLLVFVSVLFFPTSGLFFGLKTIGKKAIWGKTALQKAARAGALVMVRCSPMDVESGTTVVERGGDRVAEEREQGQEEESRAIRLDNLTRTGSAENNSPRCRLV